MNRPLFLTVLVTTITFSACANSSGSSFDTESDAGGSDATLAEASADDSGPALFIDGSTAETSAPESALVIVPTAPIITVVTGAPIPTRTFSATLFGQPATGVTWSFDRGELGTISSSGVFRPAGAIGGIGKLSARVGAYATTTTVTIDVTTVDDGDPSWTATPGDAGAGGWGGVGGNGPGKPPTSAQTATLNGTPTFDPSVSLLYPYDSTVWPEGLLAPLLQWSSGGHTFDSVYVHISENHFEYKGYFASNTSGPFVDVPIPQAAWDTLGYSNGGEPVHVTLVFGQGSAAYGPYSETWAIAKANLQGTIYYDSYGTGFVRNSDSKDYYGNQYGAGTLAIAPGAKSPALVAGVNSTGTDGNGSGCRVCHTVAADGRSLVTQTSDQKGSTYAGGVAIDLVNDTTAGAGTALPLSNFAYPALSKNGSIAFSNTGGFDYPGGLGGSGTSQLYALPAGTPIATTGLPSGLQATLPAFSPDGTHLGFNFWGGSFTTAGGTVNGDRASLAVLDFDGTSAFSNPRVVYTPGAGRSVTYSSFFPNSAGIVFEVELSHPDRWGYTFRGNTSELWWLDVASGQAHRLDALDGYTPAGTSYLPSSPPPSGGGTPAHTGALDTTVNYEPAVSPIAAGGYVWVVFTSRRMYGHVAQIPPWTSDPRFYPWRDQVTPKKLWVAAIDLNAKPGTDPSHPAFYLPAQELHAGNARGYWAVEPCRAIGQGCVTGDQCCAGYCQPASDGGALQCTAQPPPCSGEFEKCSITSDCCGAGSGIQCVNGLCTQGAPK